jgi:predicted transcriptional regulator
MKKGTMSQGKLLMKRNDAETIIRLYYEILYVLKLKGPLNTNEVAHCLHVDERKVSNALRLLTRKRFLRSSGEDGSRKYQVVSMGTTLLDNLMILMTKEKSSTPSLRRKNQKFDYGDSPLITAKWQ